MAGDSMLDLYHRTTPEAARAILAEGRLVTRENRPEAYCSTRVDGQGEGYGVAVVHLRVRESLAELDDEFPGGEQHFRVPLDAAQVVEAFTLDRDGTRHSLTPLPNTARAAFPTTASQVCTPPAVGIATGDRPARRHRPPAAGMER